MSGKNPEARAREKIDEMLKDNGWPEIETMQSSDTGYREEVRTERNNRADYVLYFNGNPIGIVEAKKESINPANKRDQPRTYAKNLDNSNSYRNTYSVPFTYTTNGERIVFEDLRKDAPRYRDIYTFHSPKDLESLLNKDYPSIMNELRNMDGDDIDKGLWNNQFEGFNEGLSLITEGVNKILYTMATGTGKTRLGIALSYALLESGLANRVLVAVDTDRLRTETKQEYKNYEPVGSEPFSKNYLVGKLDEDSNNRKDVVVTTTQKLSRRLHQDNHDYSVGEFDVVIADEVHRGIFNNDGLGIAVDYFDAIEIGFTATPHERTLERYDEEAYEYTYLDALRDGLVSPFQNYSVNTQIMTEKGFKNDGKWYAPTQIGEEIIVRDSQEKVAQALRKNTNVKDELTLVFAQNRLHARIIVEDLRDEYRDIFDNPYEEIKQVTGDKFEPDVTLSEFKQPHRPPHIIVTVDMVTTGVDIRPLNNIVLMRPVKSKVLFNQMMGRGTRKHETKDHFKIFDCVKAFEYHDGVPPFATKDISYDVTYSGSSTPDKSEPKEEPDIIEKSDIDEIIRNCRMYPSKDNKWVERDEFVREIQSVIRSNASELSNVIENCSSVEEVDSKIESLFKNKWKHYRKKTILDAFDDLDTLYLLCVRTIEGYDELRSKGKSAREKTIRQHNLTGEQKKLIQDVSHRAVIERDSITACDFYNPPLSDDWGIDTAEEVIENLDTVLDDFNKNFLSIEPN